MTLDQLEDQLRIARDTVRAWQDRAADLARQAAEARVKHQAHGRGLIAMLLGPKIRSGMRKDAALANARVAREVAKARTEITNGKRAAQQQIRAIQEAIKAVKAQQSTAKKREAAASRVTTTKAVQSQRTLRSASTGLSLLEKLKEAHTLGLLTDDEYERKRRELVARL